MPDSPGLFTTAVAPPSGIGTQVVTDDFNRANQSPITGNWTSGANMNLTSNTAQPVNFAGSDAHAIWNTWASGNDQYSQAEITAVGTSAGAGCGVAVRHSSVAATNTMYRLVIDASGNIELGKITTGSFAFIASRSVTYGASKKLGLSVTGSSPATLKIWYDGAQIGADETDASSPLTTGVPAIVYSSIITSGTIDNWDAGTVP